VTPELVEKYCKDHKEDERKLAAFCQLKVALAPCIEAVILLDRVAYLLEQVGFFPDYRFYFSLFLY